MHRTLYCPDMIETFRTCRRAYELAYMGESSCQGPDKLAVICKHFILRALAQINKGRIATIPQVQKYMGQHWPADKMSEVALDKEMAARAFLHVYKTLLRYVGTPYCTPGAKIVGVALKVRARVPHVRVYVEDTLDLVLWYPAEQKLEFVDFQIQAPKTFDPAWPSTALLVKKFLAERLQTRWPFETLSIVSQRVGVNEYTPVRMNIEETTYRLHWSEVVRNLEEIKEFESQEPKEYGVHPAGSCHHCKVLETRCRKVMETNEEHSVSLSA